MGGFLPPAQRHSGLTLGLCTCISLLLLMTGERLPTASLRGVGAYLFAPLDRVVLAADRLAAAWRENQALHLRIASLELEAQRLRTGGVENQRLREALDLPAARSEALRPVEIVSFSGEGLVTAATLSAGGRAGIREGNAVITLDGLLGRVSEVYPDLSRAILLTDPNVAVACEIESTGVLGVARFATAPHPRLVLTSVPLGDSVLVGSRVVTSGLSQHFPRGLPVGRVAKVGRDVSGLTQDIEIAPAARLSRVRHAFVMLSGAGAPSP
ncbi:MAG: rod shape-determining protein MreC [Candidatus Eisenbacteria bacterium]